MKSYLENKETEQFWEIEYDDVIIIRSGRIGTEGDFVILGDDDTIEICGVPADDYAFMVLIVEKQKEGYTKILNGLDLLKQIETTYNVKLKGDILEFYTSGEVLNYQNKHHNDFGCKINFDGVCTKIDIDQEYAINIIPIAGLVSADGYDDEQAWIGINLDEEHTKIHELFTSNHYTESFLNIEEFVKGFK